jgi:hypothetical protein
MAAGGSSPSDTQRNQRYVYLVGRLNSRQMTMEEATELFSLMQTMLRQAESARQALARSIPPPPSPGAAARPALVTAPTGTSDDFFLMGILAMGAGAGLLAAMAKRLQDATPAPPGPGTSGSPPGTRSA